MSKKNLLPFLSHENVQAFRNIVGKNNVLIEEDDKAKYLEEWRDKYQGVSLLVIKPSSTSEISEILKYCNNLNIKIVPQGGNTGLVGGQIPLGGEVIISLERLNKILEIDIENNSIITEAGVILENLQKAACDNERYFPLSLASQGSCQIGGNLGANAGGVHVFSYGNLHDLCLGLEVVLADGSIITDLSGLRKNNTGYHLKHLFIGSEGSLGIITKASLKLFAKPKNLTAILIGTQSIKNAINILNKLNASSIGKISAYELISKFSLQTVYDYRPDINKPIEELSNWQILCEVDLGIDVEHNQEIIQNLLMDMYEEGLVEDVVVSKNINETNSLWELRHLISEAQKPLGGSIKNDVSLPISSIEEFIEKANAAISKLIPNCRFVTFGHLGDGNLHYNISQPEGMDKDEYLSHWDEVCEIVNEIVNQLGGSISAEHGIGRMKRDKLLKYKDKNSLETMRRIKLALDPNKIMNPGCII